MEKEKTQGQGNNDAQGAIKESSQQTNVPDSSIQDQTDNNPQESSTGKPASSGSNDPVQNTTMPVDNPTVASSRQLWSGVKTDEGKRIEKYQQLIEELTITPLPEKPAALRKFVEMIKHEDVFVCGALADHVKAAGICPKKDFLQQVTLAKKQSSEKQGKRLTDFDIPDKPTEDILRDRFLAENPGIVFGLDRYWEYENGIYNKLDIDLVGKKMDSILVKAKDERINP